MSYLKGYFVIVFTIFLYASCNNKSSISIDRYHSLVNDAELAICKLDFEKALALYDEAFKHLKKPFASESFNAALVAAELGYVKVRDKHLQLIIDNSDDLDFLNSVFVDQYLSKDSWDTLIKNRSVDYSDKLRNEFELISERDQLFRPMYDTHDDTINANRKINLERILQVSDSLGFPSHFELGYNGFFNNQGHNVVLHHSAQRRSYDKSVIDLEQILFKAVRLGRIDPESAIVYLSYQNDPEKDLFHVHSTWQYRHRLLPDSLLNKVWVRDLDDSTLSKINCTRDKWFADSIEDIEIKSAYSAKSEIPFVFTSIRRLVSEFYDNQTLEEVMKQYELATGGMKEVSRID